MNSEKMEFSIPLLTISSYDQKDNYTGSDKVWTIGNVNGIPDIGSSNE